MWGRRSSFGVTVGKHGGKRPLEDLVVDGRLILKWALKNGVGEYGLCSSDAGYVQMTGSRKCGEFFDCLRTC